MMNQRKKNEKIVQEKLKLDNKEMKRFNPVSFLVILEKNVFSPPYSIFNSA